jgi:DNA-binding transcriptional ArsR family regulator
MTANNRTTELEPHHTYKATPASSAAVSQQLAILQRGKLVTSRRAGRSVLYHRTALATRLLTAGGSNAG